MTLAWAALTMLTIGVVVCFFDFVLGSLIGIPGLLVLSAIAQGYRDDDEGYGD